MQRCSTQLLVTGNFLKPSGFYKQPIQHSVKNSLPGLIDVRYIAGAGHGGRRVGDTLFCEREGGKLTRTVELVGASLREPHTNDTEGASVCLHIR